MNFKQIGNIIHYTLNITLYYIFIQFSKEHDKYYIELIENIKSTKKLY